MMSANFKNITINDLCKDTKRFIDDIQKEPDRSIPIVAVAFLDDVLGKLLEAYFIQDKKIVKKMFEYPGILSNFAARSDLAYCLGLIPPKTYEDIKKIRKIRNEFSHSHNPVDFEDKKVAQICKTLFFYNLVHKDYDYEYKARDQFLTSAILVVNTILLKALSTKSVKMPKDYEVAQIVKV